MPVVGGFVGVAVTTLVAFVTIVWATVTIGSVVIGSETFRGLRATSSRFGDNSIVSVDNAQISCLEDGMKKN